MSSKIVPILWPTEHNYRHFREINGNKFPESLAQYYDQVDSWTKDHSSSYRFVRVDFDPARLLNFANSRGTPVDGSCRAAYAEKLFREQNGKTKKPLTIVTLSEED